jgi:predicted nucleic acid-binding protein
VTGVTLDAGALIGLERGSHRVTALLARMIEQRQVVYVPAGVVAQAWRGGQQAKIARLLSARETTVVPLDELTARATGVLAGKCGHSDVVDVSVALCARQYKTPVVTTDPGDIRSVDSSLRLYTV